MRDFLNAILEFIQSESLSDDEFDSLELSETTSYTVAVYSALKTILEARDGVSDQIARLRTYFMARGVDVNATPAARTPTSNIFIGSPL